MTESLSRILKDAGMLTLLFIPIHQAGVEIFKLFGTKTKEYFEALKYIVFGPEKEKEKLRANYADSLKYWLGERWFSELGRTPRELDPGVRGKWVSGPEARLIESFLLRSLGDSPVSEISDSDIKNVVRIARQSAPEEVQKAIEALEYLLAKKQNDPKKALEVLKLAEPKGKLAGDIKEWTDKLKTLDAKDGTVEIHLDQWRRATVEKYLPGELRAKNELANALKSAEFRYHQTLFWFSTLLAAAESLVISRITDASGLVVFAVFLVSFGALILAPRGTKSLLDAIVGIGSRLKG